MSDEVEELCVLFHDAYEAAAVEAGWETQERSRKPWADVPEANKATMRATVRAVLESDWLAARLRVVAQERDLLAQAIWDARIELGFDHDGDKHPRHAIAGMGYEWFARAHVEEAREVRRDYDAALDEIPDPTALDESGDA